MPGFPVPGRLAVLRPGLAGRQPADVRRAARPAAACRTTPRAISPPASCRSRTRGRSSTPAPRSRSPTSSRPTRPRFITADSRARGARSPGLAQPPSRRGQRGRLAARVADRRLRAGRPDAAQRARGPRPRRRDAGDADALRPRRPGHRRFRPPLPAGPAAPRARGPLRAGLERGGRADEQLGQPRRHPQRAAGHRPHRRPADRRFAAAT